MFERDYLMKLISDLIQAMAKSIIQADEEENPYLAARSLELAIGNAVDMDASLFLSLEPASMSSMLGISSMDANGAEYIARSLALASVYNRQAGDDGLADLRLGQARAVADTYGLNLDEMDFDESVDMEEAVSTAREFLADQEKPDE